MVKEDHNYKYTCFVCWGGGGRGGLFSFRGVNLVCVCVGEL